MTNPDQTITLVFTAIGILAGAVSYYLSNTVILALVLPVPIYATTLSILTRLVKEKKVKQMVYSSSVTFVLIWLLVWIFLYNLK